MSVRAKVKAKRAAKAIIDVIFLDDNGKWISHKWASYIGAKQPGDPPANHNWKTYTGRVDIPENTKKIKVALQIYGPGKVWFDDVRAAYADSSETAATPAVEETESPTTFATPSHEIAMVDVDVDLQELIDDKSDPVHAVLTAGPVPMMKNVAKVTEAAKILTIASLNPIMVDGTGMCGGCRVTVGGKQLFACVDGPEFDAHQVDFDALTDRLCAYREQEQRA